MALHFDRQKMMPFLYAGALGLLAVALMHLYLEQQRAALNAQRKKLMAEFQKPIDVVVAKQDMPAGRVVGESDLQVVPIPEKFVQPYATSFPAELTGKVTIAPIAQGEQVLGNKLRLQSELPRDATLSGVTPEGKRAVTIGADMLTGVGGFVRPGDFVDIFWTVTLPQSAGGSPGETVTLALFQHVPVLAVDDQMLGRALPEREEGANYTVTLALTPQETAVLLYARQQGAVQLSLRPRADTGDVAAVPPAHAQAVMQAVLGNAATPGQPAPQPQRTVEVIKGLERTRVPIEQ